MQFEPRASRAHLVETLFAMAVRLSPAERAEFLSRACDTLRTELKSLLAADTTDDRFIQSPIAAVALRLPVSSYLLEDADMTGRSIGPYQIAEWIGAGGMGSVYRAFRNDQFRMHVALKLIKRGADTDSAIRRFRNERQILAQLQHPNIARLLDGGATADGLPYFVMEYVDGQPITTYSKTAKLDIPARLRLFCSVCGAVQYAHQNLIVHRDLKPGNVLITPEGVPKLLDFGIAKLLTPTTESEQTALSLTGAGVRLMTRDYASPEQVLGLPLTTSTDIYSLGVVLYELLTGERPYRVKAPGAAAVEQAICHEESRSPASICKQVDADLSKIVLMALRKEPEWRYASVEQFADDIRRYLAHRPILARKHTVPYRFRKLIQRHTMGVVTTAAVVIGLLAGVSAVHREAVRAEDRVQQVRKLARIMVFDLYDDIAFLPAATKAQQLLVRTALEYLDSLEAEKVRDSQLRMDVATAYEKIGDVEGDPTNSHLHQPEAAVESYRKALGIANGLAPSAPALELITRLNHKTGDVQHRYLAHPGNLAPKARSFR